MTGFFRQFLLLFVVPFVSLGVSVSAHSNDFSPYEGEPPVIELTSEQHESLKKGEAIYPSPLKGSDGGSAIAVFRVNAPAKIVWDVIANFDQYKEWVDGVIETKTYKDPKPENDLIFIKFKVGKFFASYNYHIVHKYPMLKTGWGTWSLDTDQANDLDACRGFWRVTPVADNPNQSDVVYSIDIRVSGLILSLLRSTFAKNGARNATSWVKKQAEAQFAATKTALLDPVAAPTK